MRLLYAIFLLFGAAAARQCENRKTNAKLVCYYSELGAVDGCLCTDVVLPENSGDEDVRAVRAKVKGGRVLLTVSEFSEKLIGVLENGGVDGVEVDLRKMGGRGDIPGFISTLKDKLKRDVFVAVAVPPQPERLAKFFDFKGLAKHADVFILQTAFLGMSANATFHPSRLSGLWDIQNIDSLVDLLTGMGAPLSKLVITAPVQALQFTLKNESLTTPGSPALNVKSLTREELCVKMSSHSNWTLERDQDQAGPYIFSKNTWIAFDDETSMDIKAKYVRVRNLAGLALKDLSQDGAKCGKSLLEAAFTGLSRQSRAPRGAILQSLKREILEVPARPLDTVQVSPYRISRVIDVHGNIHTVRKDTRTEFECARQGYYVHPRSCGRFYRCVKFDQLSDEFSVFEFDCPAGLSFDSRYEVCVWPGSLPYSSPCSGSSEIAPVPRSRFVCPGAEGFYADAENCRWFFACLDHGKSPLSAYEFRCPFGLAFDEDRLLCEWPWLVPKCKFGGAVEASRTTLTSYNGLGALNLVGVQAHQGQVGLLGATAGLGGGLGAYQGANVGVVNQHQGQVVLGANLGGYHAGVINQNVQQGHGGVLGIIKSQEVHGTGLGSYQSDHQGAILNQNVQQGHGGVPSIIKSQEVLGTSLGSYQSNHQGAIRNHNIQQGGVLGTIKSQEVLGTGLGSYQSNYQGAILDQNVQQGHVGVLGTVQPVGVIGGDLGIINHNAVNIQHNIPKAVVYSVPLEEKRILGGVSTVGLGGVLQTSQIGGISSASVTPVTILPPTSVPVAAAPVAKIAETYNGGVVANVPELQYKIVKTGDFNNYDTRGLANSSQFYVNYISATPAPAPLPATVYRTPVYFSGQQFVPGSSQEGQQYFKNQGGYQYVKNQDQGYQYVKNQEQDYQYVKNQAQGYQYVKPSVSFGKQQAGYQNVGNGQILTSGYAVPVIHQQAAGHVTHDFSALNNGGVNQVFANVVYEHKPPQSVIVQPAVKVPLYQAQPTVASIPVVTATERSKISYEIQPTGTSVVHPVVTATEQSNVVGIQDVYAQSTARPIIPVQQSNVASGIQDSVIYTQSTVRPVIPVVQQSKINLDDSSYYAQSTYRPIVPIVHHVPGIVNNVYQNLTRIVAPVQIPYQQYKNDHLYSYSFQNLAPQVQHRVNVVRPVSPVPVNVVRPSVALQDRVVSKGTVGVVHPVLATSVPVVAQDVKSFGYSYQVPQVRNEAVVVPVQPTVSLSNQAVVHDRVVSKGPVGVVQPAVAFVTSPAPAVVDHTKYGYNYQNTAAQVSQFQNRVINKGSFGIVQPIVAVTTPTPVIGSLPYTYPNVAKAAVGVARPTPVDDSRSPFFSYSFPNTVPQVQSTVSLRKEALVQPFVAVTTPTPVDDSKSLLFSYSFQNTLPQVQPTVSLRKEAIVQPFVPVTTPTPIISTSLPYTYQNVAKGSVATKQNYQIPNRVSVVTTPTPLPKDDSLLLSYSYQNTIPHNPVISHGTVRPSIVGVTPAPAIHDDSVLFSYSYQNTAPVVKSTVSLEAQQVHNGFGVTTPRPVIIEDYSNSRLSNQNYQQHSAISRVQSQGSFGVIQPSIGIVQPSVGVVTSTPATLQNDKSVLFSYNYENTLPRLQPAVSLSKQDFIQNIRKSQGYIYSKPKITFEEGGPSPIYTVPVNVPIQPVVAVTTPKPSGFAYDGNFGQKIIQDKVVVQQVSTPQPTISYVGRKPVEEELFVKKNNYLTYQKPTVLFEEKQPVPVTQGYVYTKPKITFEEGGPSPIYTVPVKVPIQPTVAVTTPKLSGFTYDENFGQKIIQDKVVVQQVSTPPTVSYVAKQPVEEELFVKKGSYLTYQRPAVSFEESPPVLVQDKNVFIEGVTPQPTISYVGRKPAEEELFVKKNSYLTYQKPTVWFEEKQPVPVTQSYVYTKPKITFEEGSIQAFNQESIGSTLVNSAKVSQETFGSKKGSYGETLNAQIPIDIEDTLVTQQKITIKERPTQGYTYSKPNIRFEEEPTTTRWAPPTRGKVIVEDYYYITPKPKITTLPISQKIQRPVVFKATPVPLSVVEQEYVSDTPLQNDYVSTNSFERPINVVVNAERPKTYIRVNDFNPLLPAKLGAQCTCTSTSNVLTLKRVKVDDNGVDVRARTNGRRTDNLRVGFRGSSTFTTPLPLSSTQRSLLYSTTESPRLRTVTPRPLRIEEAPRAPLRIKEASVRIAPQPLRIEEVDAVTSISVDNERVRDDGIDCQRAGLFRHPKQCNKFYSCRWDCNKKKFALHIFNCPVHLTFDSTLGACNWPSKGPACAGNTLLLNDL